MDTASDEEVRFVRLIRLARVQAAQGKYDDALATLKVETPGEFDTRLADARGDVLLAKGDRAGALREYLAGVRRRERGPHRRRPARSEDPDLAARRRRTSKNPPEGNLDETTQPAAARVDRRRRFSACVVRHEDKKVDRAAKLADLRSRPCASSRLGASVGGGGKKLRLGLGLAAAVNRLFAAGRDGDVAAFDLKTGKQVWRTKTKLEFTGGTGVGNALVAVGTVTARLHSLRTQCAERWRAQVKGEVLSAPAVADREVVVRTVDGKLRALASDDGHELWVTEQQIPRLTLRGLATPVIARDVVIIRIRQRACARGEHGRRRHGVGFAGVTLAWPHRTRAPQRHRCRRQGLG